MKTPNIGEGSIKTEHTQKNFFVNFIFWLGDRYLLHSPKPILNLTCLSAFSSPLVSNEILLPSPTQMVSNCRFHVKERGRESESEVTYLQHLIVFLTMVDSYLQSPFAGKNRPQDKEQSRVQRDCRLVLLRFQLTRLNVDGC